MVQYYLSQWKEVNGGQEGAGTPTFTQEYQEALATTPVRAR